MKTKLFSFLMCSSAFLSYADIPLAENGKTPYAIVLPEPCGALEKTSTEDLSKLLKEATGAEFSIVQPADAEKFKHRIFIGYSSAMTEKLGDTLVSTPANEERIAMTKGNDVFLYGGGKCGTSFAIYEFLDRAMNMRFYSPVSQPKITKKSSWKLSDQNWRILPSFEFRDLLYGRWNVAGNPDALAFFRRARTSNNHTMSPFPIIGALCHTVPYYMPAGGKRKQQSDGASFLKDKEYFKTNPEYFSLDSKGQRTSGLHLCFSNQEMRAEFQKNIEMQLKNSRYNPKETGFITLDQADIGDKFCYCKECEVLEKKYGAPAGAFYDFQIDIAQKLAQKYPMLQIRFLAYGGPQQTEMPPTNTDALPGGKFPVNLHPQFAPINGDFSKPWTSESNIPTFRNISEWAKVIRGGMYVWYYPSTFPRPIVHYTLAPFCRRLAADMKTLYDNNGRYFFMEQCNMLEGMGFSGLQIFLAAQLSNDITCDSEALIREYIDYVYGPAAPLMLEYFNILEKGLADEKKFLRWFPDPRVLTFVNAKNLIRFQKMFDEMENLSAKDSEALFHVRACRMNLDLTTLLLYNDILRKEPAFAFSRETLRKRVLDTFDQVILRTHSLAVTEKGAIDFREKNVKQVVFGAVEYACIVSSSPKPLPEEFSGIPAERVFQAPPFINKSQVPHDPDAAYGIATSYPAGDGFNHGIYDQTGKLKALEQFVKADFDGKYHLYKIGRTRLSQEMLVSAPNDVGGYGAVPVGYFFDPDEPEKEFDVYVSSKFEKDRMFTDRAVLIAVPKDKAGAVRPELFLSPGVPEKAGSYTLCHNGNSLEIISELPLNESLEWDFVGKDAFPVHRLMISSDGGIKGLEIRSARDSDPSLMLDRIEKKAFDFKAKFEKNTAGFRVVIPLERMPANNGTISTPMAKVHLGGK